MDHVGKRGSPGLRTRTEKIKGGKATGKAVLSAILEKRDHHVGATGERPRSAMATSLSKLVCSTSRKPARGVSKAFLQKQGGGKEGVWGERGGVGGAFSLRYRENRWSTFSQPSRANFSSAPEKQGKKWQGTAMSTVYLIFGTQRPHTELS